MNTDITHALFGHIELWSQQTPDTVMIDEGSQQLTYRDVRTLAKQIAGELRSLGVEQGDVLAMRLPTALSLVFAAAALHEGVATCQLPPAGASGFVADWLLSLEPDDSPLARNNIVVDAEFLARIRERDALVKPQNFASADALCRIVFSSGTTGDPKPIALTCDMVVHRAQAANDLVFGSSAFLCALDLGSASGFHTFVGALMAGHTYFVPGGPERNLEVITKHRVASIKASPVQISLLLDAAMREGESLASLEIVYSAGSVVPLGIRKALKAQTRARLINLFGSSEVGRAAEREIEDDDLTFAGTVVAGTELQVVDADDQPVETGAEGAVRYRREHQATEYYNNPEVTAKAFRHGWFYTGDIGRLDEGGRLYLLGRASDIINAGGVKVNPTDAERVALGISGVVDAVGFAHENESGLVEFAMALVVLDEENIGGVIAALKLQLGSLAPTLIFTLPEIPKNSAGKVSRAEVAALYRSIVGLGSQVEG